MSRPSPEYDVFPWKREDGPVPSDSDVAVEIELADGRRDVILAMDAEDTGREGRWMLQEDANIRTDGELCMVRQGPDGELLSVAMCNGKTAHVGGTALDLVETADYVEVRYDSGVPAIVAGNGIPA